MHTRKMTPYIVEGGKMRNCGMWDAEWKLERCCGTVGKMRNAEICRMWAIVAAWPS